MQLCPLSLPRPVLLPPCSPTCNIHPRHLFKTKRTHTRTHICKHSGLIMQLLMRCSAHVWGRRDSWWREEEAAGGGGRRNKKVLRQRRGGRGAKKEEKGQNRPAAPLPTTTKPQTLKWATFLMFELLCPHTGLYFTFQVFFPPPVWLHSPVYSRLCIFHSSRVMEKYGSFRATSGEKLVTIKLWVVFLTGSYIIIEDLFKVPLWHIFFI